MRENLNEDLNSIITSGYLNMITIPENQMEVLPTILNKLDSVKIHQLVLSKDTDDAILVFDNFVESCKDENGSLFVIIADYLYQYINVKYSKETIEEQNERLAMLLVDIKVIAMSNSVSILLINTIYKMSSIECWVYKHRSCTLELYSENIIQVYCDGEGIVRAILTKSRYQSAMLEWIIDDSQKEPGKPLSEIFKREKAELEHYGKLPNELKSFTGDWRHDISLVLTEHEAAINMILYIETIPDDNIKLLLNELEIDTIDFSSMESFDIETVLNIVESNIKNSNKPYALWLNDLYDKFPKDGSISKMVIGREINLLSKLFRPLIDHYCAHVIIINKIYHKSLPDKYIEAMNRHVKQVGWLYYDEYMHGGAPLVYTNCAIIRMDLNDDPISLGYYDQHSIQASLIKHKEREINTVFDIGTINIQKTKEN